MNGSSNWLTLIKSLANDAEFSDGALDYVIEETEAAIGLTIPVDLRAPLSETDGVRADHGVNVVLSCSDNVKI